MQKIKILIASVVLFISMMSVPSLRPKAEAQVSVSLQVFYDNLSPYGVWSYYPRYGYVWHPYAERNFCPYRTRGHWVWSDEYEWIWVSDYEWGWAPFHYGRWFYDPYYGWLWAPDYDWAPAWVTWRSSNSYYGWAPLGPGINISLNFVFGSYNPPDYYWSFVPCRYITSPVVYNYVLSTQQNTTIIQNTTVINNYSVRGGPSKNVFVNGPKRNEVEKFARVTPVKFRESSKPGRMQARGNQVVAYKPNVSNKGSAKPSKVVPIEKMKRIDKGANQPVKNQPQKKEVKGQPQKKEIQKNQPSKNQPVKTQPPKKEMQMNQPMKDQPVRNEPRTKPMKTEPQRNQPVMKQPSQNQPQRTQPMKNQPPKNQPQPQQSKPTKKGKGV